MFTSDHDGNYEVFQILKDGEYTLLAFKDLNLNKKYEILKKYQCQLN